MRVYIDSWKNRIFFVLFRTTNKSFILKIPCSLPTIQVRAQKITSKPGKFSNFLQADENNFLMAWLPTVLDKNWNHWFQIKCRWYFYRLHFDLKKHFSIKLICKNITRVHIWNYFKFSSSKFSTLKSVASKISFLIWLSQG